MMAKFKILVFFTFFFFTISTKAQLLTGYVGDINIGIGFTDKSKSVNYFPAFKPLISGKAGLFFEKKVNSSIILGYEFLLIQRNTIMEMKYTSKVVYQRKFKQSSFSTYFGTPAYLRILFKGMGIYIGVQPAWLLSNFSKIETERINNNNLIVFYEGEEFYTTKTNISSEIILDLSLKLGLDFRLNKKLDLKVDFQYSFFNNEESYKNKEITLGLRYYTETLFQN